jgi:hypothetical protein
MNIGQATAEGVDAVGLVELHGLLIHLLRVVAVLLLDVLHQAGSASTSASCCVRRLGVDRPDEEADEDGDQDDGKYPKSPDPAFEEDETGDEDGGDAV